MIEKLNDIIKVDDNGNIVSNQWIEWHHFGVSSKVGVSREKERKVLKRLNHCETCTNLSGCYFVERNMPSLPLHPHCDCKKLHITYDKVNAKAKARCDIKKFTEYVFTNKGLLNGKSELFDLLGYTIKDSDYLQGLLCVKALEQYKLGNYKLKDLNKFGQRLAIPMEINGYKFYSGWMVEPEGKIRNTTPFGGWIK